MTKIKTNAKECEKCGVRLMNKEERFCASCAKTHQKKIRWNLLIFSFLIAVGGSGLLYLAEYLHLSFIWKFIILVVVMAAIPFTMKKIRNS